MEPEEIKETNETAIPINSIIATNPTNSTNPINPTNPTPLINSQSPIYTKDTFSWLDELKKWKVEKGIDPNSRIEPIRIENYKFSWVDELTTLKSEKKEENNEYSEFLLEYGTIPLKENEVAESTAICNSLLCNDSFSSIL